MQTFQYRRARQIVAYAAAHSPFYRNLWGENNHHIWQELPTVDKTAMMAHFETFNTVGVSKEDALAVALRAETTRDFRPTVGKFTVGLSSGTSGHRGLFLVSPQEQAAWAGVILARALHRLPRRGLRIAFFLRAFSNLYARAGNRLVEIRYFDLMTPLNVAVAQLNQFAPDLIVAPPSLLGFLAEARREGRLQARPERLISVAEVLEPQDAQAIGAAFQAPVHQIYQCTEGLLAVSCPQGTLHLQEDIVAVQLAPLESTVTATADSAGAASVRRRFTPIVTDLWRHTQPIIRYRLNDVLQVDVGPSAPRCACGSTFRVIAAIEGRCDDICYFWTVDGERRPFFPDTLRRMVLLASSAITDYQIVQQSDGQLHIFLATLPNTAFDSIRDVVRRHADDTLAMYGCRPAALVVEEGIPKWQQESKRRRVRRVEG
ncbi:MAG: adenylate cyclase [Anaerolineales bacterium]|nr:adenylate cyclase [Anaerolineales bacterium]